MKPDARPRAAAPQARPDPYTGITPDVPGPGPLTGKAPPPPIPELPFSRNVRVEPLWISACRCPQCGEVYPHVGVMADEDLDPPCWRCEVSLGVPLSPDEAAAMAEFRWRYDRFLKAYEVASGASQAVMRQRFIDMCSSAQMQGPTLLHALERRYGDQQDAGVAAIVNGASGVET